MKAALLLGLLALSGCNCFVPVVECTGNRCHRDAGSDAGLDAGRDAGAVDSGFTPTDGGQIACALWDGGGVGKCAAITGYVATATECLGECVFFPIQSAGVFPTLAECVGCGCDVAKFTAVPPQPITPATYCDDLFVKTSIPRLLDEAFPGYDGGCQALGPTQWVCTLWQRDLGDAGYARACAATLVPRVTEVQCMVYVH